jgi:hypothetical protein
LQVRLPQAPVTSLAQPEGSNPVREGSLDARPIGVEARKLFGLFALSGRLDGLVLFFWL